MAKIRNGFVSNSSSSSFCILGISVSRSEFENKNLEVPWDCKEFDIERGLENYYDEWVVGISPNRLLKETQPLPKIREDLRVKLEKYFNREVTIEEVQFRTDGGYDG